MKTAIYLRASLDRDMTKVSIDYQREHLHKLCADKCWDDPIEYLDRNVSATAKITATGKRRAIRPAYEDLCEDIRNGVVAKLAVFDLDRLYREPRELEDFIDLVERHRVELANVGGDVDLSTPSGRMFARMKGTVAKYEVEQKSARQKAANKQRAKSGKAWVTRPFGYTYEVEKDASGKVVKAWNDLVPNEADAIRKACRDLLNGASLWSIAKQWNAEGLKTSKGYDWTGSTVRQMLLRPRNAGLAVYDVHATKFRAATIHESVLEGVEASWPAIVSRAEWESVCRLLADPKRLTGKSIGRKHLLSGIAICDVCKNRMFTTARKTKDGKRVVYQCKNMGCMKIVRDLGKTDQVVVDIVTRRLAKPDAVKALAKPTVDTKALRDEINVLERQIREAEHDYDEGLIDGRRYKAKIDRVTEKLAPLKDKMLGVHMSRDVKDLAGRPNARELFDALPLDRRRGVIDTLAVVTIHRQTKGGRFDPTAITVVDRNQIA
jgi:site-specific DNA recombinase